MQKTVMVMDAKYYKVGFHRMRAKAARIRKAAAVGAGLLIIIGLVMLYPRLETRSANARISTILNEKVSKNSGCVVPGRDGWLFYTEDLLYHLIQWTRLNNDAAVVRLARDMKELGIDLMVVPVPTPLEIYPEKLIGFKARESCPQRARFIGRLRKAGVWSLDLLKPLHRAKKKAPVYIRTETHLARAGYEAAAREIAREIRRRYPHLAGSAGRYQTIDSVLAGFKGDLARTYYPPAEGGLVDVELALVRDSSGAHYQDSTASEIVIFGDSFVWTHRQYGADLSAHIAKALGRPLAMYSQVGGFTVAPKRMRRIVEGRKHATVLVVWVFTARTLISQLEY